MKVSNPKHTLFYDGTCGLCHIWVKFALKKDKNHKFYFAPLQGKTIKEKLSKEQLQNLPDSIVIITEDETLLFKSSAVSFLLKELDSVWSIPGSILSLLPQSFCNFAYDFIAKIRHRLFKKPDNFCPILSPEITKYFLD